MVAVDESPPDDVDSEVDDDLDDGYRRYGRASEDVLNAVFAAVLVGIAALIANAAHETMVGLESDMLAGWNQLPDVFGKFVIGAVQVLALVYPVALAIVLLVNRQVRATVVEVSARPDRHDRDVRDRLGGQPRDPGRPHGAPLGRHLGVRQRISRTRPTSPPRPRSRRSWLATSVDDGAGPPGTS